MKISILSLLFILSFNLVSGQHYEMDTIQYVGHSEDYYDLVIVAEGYQEDDMDQYIQDVNNLKPVFQSNNALGNMMDKFNIFAIRTPSIDEGISLISKDAGPDDPIQVSDIKDTYFGIFFKNSYRAYFLDDTTQLIARHVVSEHIPFYDVILILTNDEIGSGRADVGGVAVAARLKTENDIYAAFVVNHELGHAIGGLSDAYSDNREEGFNKTTNSDPETIRWNELLNLPDVRIDSVFEGLYIPNVDCMMNVFDPNYFCPVCKKRTEDVMSDVTTHLPPPYRALVENIDTANLTLTYVWDEVPGATHYEIIYNNSLTDSLIVRTTTTNRITYELSSEEIFSIFYVPDVSTNFAYPFIILRAFNDQGSSYFKYHEVISDVRSLTNPYPVDIPILDEFVQTSPTSYRLSFTQDEYLQATLIRIYNEDGLSSDVLTNKKIIEIRGLIPDKEYQVKYAAVYSKDIQYGNSSDFSGLLSTFDALADFDNDGFTDDVDCDDANASINPGAMEILDNDVDEDCDGNAQKDEDMDGFSNDVDCDDTNADVNPNADEVIYNGLDDDCDPGTLDDDLDMDGYINADDCDDDNADIYPGATEIPNNGIDEDCDGMDLISSIHELGTTSVNIYPNPVSKEIHIQVAGSLSYEIRIYSINGILIYIQQNQNMISVENMISGTYLLEIQDLNTNQKIMERIVVVK